MPDQGEQASEPTSYGLQPPAPRTGYEPTQVGSTEPERLIGGRYRLRSRLGHGGMGTVWRAHDEAVDRDVAVKEPRVPDHLSERERQTCYERMRREARTAAKIDHPSVVTVHDVVVEDGRPWIVMELVNGRSLGDVLAEGTLDQREAARIGLAVLGALAAAHDTGVLHRDVKPDNVLLGRHDRVVLTDFGIAQMEGEQGLTETGAFVGSPEFIAPERVLGQRPGPESDLWSLGVVLYAAVEGMSPFRRSNTPATLQAVLSAEPQVPSRGSGALGALIMRLLRKDPAARPDAAEARQVLEEVARPPQQATLAARTFGGADGISGRAAGLLRGRSRAVRFGALGGALAVVLALVLVLVDPFSGGGIPDGWKVYNEDKRVKATLAVPADYVRSVDEDSVTYTSEDEEYEVWVVRVTDEEMTPIEVANDRLDWYKNGVQSTWTNVKGQVTEAEYRGSQDASELTVTYNPEDNQNKARQSKQFFYIDKNAVRWRLAVKMPGGGKGKERGEQVYADAVKHLDIHGQ